MNPTLVDRRSLSVAPERSTEQRLSALERANEIRGHRAQLKRDLAAGRVTVAALLAAESLDARLETMKVFDLLVAAPKYGRVRVNQTLQRCRISPSKTLGGMSPRQRLELVGLLRSYSPSRRRTQPLTVRARVRSRTDAYGGDRV